MTDPERVQNRPDYRDRKGFTREERVIVGFGSLILDRPLEFDHEEEIAVVPQIAVDTDAGMRLASVMNNELTYCLLLNGWNRTLAA